ncbi:hypothetical protein C4571_03415 [Candidatus Parcubacteria bacterium]|nr:MAG: hypothetical protein C4571_03415 [Candidatus Parcubacteria bacterium]
MKITKIGHSCLLIEERSARILTDPGGYSAGQNAVGNLDILLITQEHGDHCDVDSIKGILKNNPGAKVFTNRGAGKLLEAKKIAYDLLEDGQSITLKGVLIEAFGKKHAEIYKTVPPVDNTGYLIARRLYHPGDALYNPGVKVEILALPVAGPWIKISEAIDYAKELQPKICFPIHDGMLKEGRAASAHVLPPKVLEPLGIKFVVLEEGKTMDF